MKKRFVSTLCLLLCAVLILAYGALPCYAESNDSPASISIFWPDKLELTAENDRVLAELERRTNTKISFVTAPSDSYIDKLQLMITSGDHMDIISNVDNWSQRTMLDTWIQDGVIIPYSQEMLDVSPDLVAIYNNPNAPYYRELMQDGKIYFIPNYWNKDSMHPNGNIWHVRKDLLDEMGLPIPDTLDDIVETMEMARERYGIYGVTTRYGIGMIGAVTGAFGLPSGGWIKLENGEYGFADIQPQMKDALSWLKMLFDKKLVEPSALTDGIDLSEEKYFAGKTMFNISNGGSHISRFDNGLKKVNPNAQEWVIPAPAGPDGLRGYTSDAGFWGVSFITNNCKEPVAAARLLNYLISSEGEMLTGYGIEGIHYNIDADGKIVLNYEERDKEGAGHFDSYLEGLHQLSSPIVSWVDQEIQDWYSFYGKDEDYMDWFNSMFRGTQVEYVIPNEIMVLFTPSWAAFQQRSSDLCTEYFTKIVLGEIDLDAGFDEFVQKWLSSGGAEAQAEMSAARAIQG